MTKFLNAILILILLVAGGRLLIRGQEYRALSQERNQLIEKLDGFRVRDSSKYLVQSVDTNDPMLFMWRVHKPSGFETAYRAEFGERAAGFGYGGNWESKLEHVSARFEYVGNKLYIDMQTARGGYRSRVGDPVLELICKPHWDDLEIEVLGQEDAIEIDVNQEVVLLSVNLPDELLTMAAKFGLHGGGSEKLFFQFSFGEPGLIEHSPQQSQGGPR